MVNISEFIIRLKKILAYYKLSAGTFADKIDVQRSSISHILNGRNKPSLEFVLKVVQNFPEVNLYWLLNGKGSFPSSNTRNFNTDENTLIQNTIKKVEATPTKSITKNKKTIDRIIIFYTDGSFHSYQERN